MKCYWILKNAGVTAFTISELLRENEQGLKLSPHPERIIWMFWFERGAQKLSVQAIKYSRCSSYK